MPTLIQQNTRRPCRAQWLRELYRGDELADGPRSGSTPLRIFALTAEADGVPADTADDDTQREFVRQWLARQGLRAAIIFSSEDYGPDFAAHLGVPHMAVDNARARVPVSGTRVPGRGGGGSGFPAPAGGGAAGRGAARVGAARGAAGGRRAAANQRCAGR